MTVAQPDQNRSVSPQTLQTIQLGVVVVLIFIATGPTNWIGANAWIGIAGFGAPLWQWAATSAIAVSSAVLFVKVGSDQAEPVRSW